MTTPAQIEANRRNAQKSTGPRPAQGRAVLSLNGLRHGLRAETAVLPSEDPAEFATLKQELEAEYRPQGIREQLVFDDLVLAAWRLERARIYDTAVQARLFLSTHGRIQTAHGPTSTMHSLGAMLAKDAREKKTLEYVMRMEGRFRRAYQQAVKELERLQTLRRQPAVTAQLAQKQERMGLVAQPSSDGAAGRGTRGSSVVGQAVSPVKSPTHKVAA